MKNSSLHERYLSGISFVLLLLLSLTLRVPNCGAADSVQSDTIEETEISFKNLLERLLHTRSVSSSPLFNSRSLRKQKLQVGEENSNATIRTEFGPGADWSCTTPENHEYDACTLSATGCSWCPLGSSNGVCLRNGQATVVNALENDHLLHLKCYDNEDEVIDESATAFWDEAASCITYGVVDCHGEHKDGNNGDHTCTWCTVNGPRMGFCLSQSLWENLVVAQAPEEVNEDASTGDQIRIDQVIHCKPRGGVNDSITTSIFRQECGWATIETDQDKTGCGSIEGVECVVQANPFPGLFGSKPGKFCVSPEQQQIMQWAIDLLRSMGWENEMSSFE
eukprot:jgi/Psemu1/291227/fgenesh1_pg.651_\